MRIGTWNLEGHWDHRHAALLLKQECDAWLLNEVNEVNEKITLDGYTVQPTVALMAPGLHWAAILSRPKLTALPDPHPASVLARVGNLELCSSILPWRSCGGQFPWDGTRHVDKTKNVLDKLRLALPLGGLVWGGDWNHALVGEEYAGSVGGRHHLLDTVAYLNLQVPTSCGSHWVDKIVVVDRPTKL